MSTKKEFDAIENYKAYKELKEAQLNRFKNKERAITEAKSTFMKNYYKGMDKRLASERKHGKNLEEAKNYYFGNALKGIYIGALEAATLTDDALFLAENMVDSYISENGGYNKIMSNVKEDTYLLAKIRRVVEDAAEEEVNDLDVEDDDVDDIEDIDIQEFPEDESDETEVSSDTELTTANITDIVSALNKAGLEIVKKGDDADNFKESEPTTDETSPEVEVDNVETDVEDPDLNVDDAEESDDATTDLDIASEPEAPTDDQQTEEAPKDNLDMSDPSNGGESNEPASTTIAEPSIDSSTTEAPATTDAAPEEPVVDQSEIDNSDEENTELDDDLAVADKNNEAKKDEELDDNLDPDTINVNDDESEDEDNDSDDDITDDDLDDEDEDDFDDIEDQDGDGEEDIEDIDIDGDRDTDIGDVEEPEATINTDPNKSMMDELENEKEVQDAIELIRTRVADAEEAFIKRNQEDKKQIDNLLSKISHNVATVEKISQDDSTKAENEKKNLEESTRMYKQKIKDMSLGSKTIFEKMTNNISESIIKDPNKVKMFLNESSRPDFGLIIETSKVMYTFLETLNTIQLEKVDGPYITKLINGIR